MLIHIVRHNEKLNDILTNYNITHDELRVNNLHISNLDNLVGGMKLKIPFLNSETLQILESTEPFIFDYYPSVNKVDLLEEIKEDKKEEETLIEKIQEENVVYRASEASEEAVNPQSESSTTKTLDNQEEKRVINQPNYYQNNHYQYNAYPRRSIYPFYIKKK